MTEGSRLRSPTEGSQLRGHKSGVTIERSLLMDQIGWVLTQGQSDMLRVKGDGQGIIMNGVRSSRVYKTLILTIDTMVGNIQLLMFP